MKFVNKILKIIWNILSIFILLILKLLTILLYSPIKFLHFIFCLIGGLISVIGCIAAILSTILYIFCHVNGIFASMDNGYYFWGHASWIAGTLIIASLPFWTSILGMDLLENFMEFLMAFVFLPLNTFTVPANLTLKNGSNSSHISDHTNDDDPDIKISVVPVMHKKEETLPVLLNNLNNLIGLNCVKKEISNLIQLEKYQQQRVAQGLKRNDGQGSNHLVFSGNPGTGKTTVARMIAGIYKELGVVSKGQLVEVDRAKLVGQYVGQTAKIVHKVVKSAIGGVLFIDEAYALVQDGYSHGDSFGQEALDTLLKEMEDHRNDLVVIVAGYTDNMEEFLNRNPGLKSRFKKTIYFDDYTPDEMLQIFEQYCISDDNILSPDARTLLLERFSELYKQRNKNFGNGRTVRNIYNEVLQQLSVRCSKINNPQKKDLQTVLSSDVQFDFNNWS